MSEVTDLIALPEAESALEVYSKEKGLEPYLQAVRDLVATFTPDLKTKKSRGEIASMAFKVTKVKSALDDIGKDVVDKLKSLPKKVDAERKRMRDELDVLRDSVRLPLTEWEEAEQARLDGYTARLVRIRTLSSEIDALDAAALEIRLAEVQGVELGKSWEEFADEAKVTKDRAETKLSDALTARRKYDAEQIELAALRTRVADQERIDREARIAREAVAEAKRQADEDSEAERQRASKKLADAANAIAEANARADRATAAERQRQADMEADEARQKRDRENDRAHRANINGTALAALVRGGLTEECAKTAITLIVQGKVPSISIHY
jgi:septal ring factor EnvC (AmiA/AmiB activator)